jgi:hypothetical protein
MVSLRPLERSRQAAPVDLSFFALHNLVIRMKVIDQGLVDNDLGFRIAQGKFSTIV